MSDLTLNIKYIREKKKYSRFQIADLLGMSIEKYTSIEEGETWANMEDIIKLAHILRTSCDELLGF